MTKPSQRFTVRKYFFVAIFFYYIKKQKYYRLLKDTCTFFLANRARLAQITATFCFIATYCKQNKQVTITTARGTLSTHMNFSSALLFLLRNIFFLDRVLEFLPCYFDHLTKLFHPIPMFSVATGLL